MEVTKEVGEEVMEVAVEGTVDVLEVKVLRASPTNKTRANLDATSKDELDTDVRNLYW